MLEKVIPNFESEMSSLKQIAPSGFIIAFNITFSGPEYYHTAYPSAWQKIYEDNNYTAFDPVFLWTFTHTGTKRWSDIKIPDLRGVMKKARAFDLTYGVCVSGKMDNKKSILTASRADREYTDDEVNYLTKKFDFLANCVTGRCGLTDKEVDVLRELNNGLSFSEISNKLNISVPTVKSRTQKARDKLDAKTTSQAVSMAAVRKYF